MNYSTGLIEQVVHDSFYAPDDFFIQQINILFPDVHVDLAILTEFEGRNADLVSGGVILGLDIFLGKIDHEMIKFIKSAECRDVHQNEYVKTLLRNVLLLRLIYNKLTLGGSSLGGFMSGLIDSELPIFHMQDKELYNLNNESVGKEDILEKMKSSSILYITKRMKELCNVDFNKELPFDIMMFNLGDHKNFGWYQAFLNWGGNSRGIKDLLLKDSSNTTKSFFLENSGTNHLLYKSVEVISEYLFHVTKVFLDTLLNKEKIGTFFFYLHRNISIINTLLGKYNLSCYEGEETNTDGLRSLLSVFYPDLQDDNYFIYTTGSSIDMKYVVFIPKYLPKFSEEHINKELRRQFHKTVALIYSSRNDGFAHEGLRIEQFISRKIYNKYIGNKNIILRDKDAYITLYSSLEQALRMTHNGICIDTVNKKILIKGEKLGSKDLLSQNATVDIISILLENIGNEVENSLLSMSGYSKNKNEMSSKILIPLLRVIEQKMGYRLPLTCTGSIGKFYLKLGKPEIDIFTLRKQ